MDITKYMIAKWTRMYPAERRDIIQEVHLAMLECPYENEKEKFVYVNHRIGDFIEKDELIPVPYRASKRKKIKPKIVYNTNRISISEDFLYKEFVGRLDEREKMVLDGKLTGESNQILAKRLNVTVRTID